MVFLKIDCFVFQVCDLLYLTFNGNCAAAIALYEVAFGVKADALRYKDAPAGEGYDPPPGTEELIMHAQFNLGSNDIYLCDTTPEMPSAFSNGVAIHVSLDSKEQVLAAFDILKEGGTVGMEPAEVFWSKLFGTLEDQFGVSWMLSSEAD